MRHGGQPFSFSFLITSPVFPVFLVRPSSQTGIPYTSIDFEFDTSKKKQPTDLFLRPTGSTNTFIPIDTDGQPSVHGAVSSADDHEIVQKTAKKASLKTTT
jgi:hypothetical protein